MTSGMTSGKRWCKCGCNGVMLTRHRPPFKHTLQPPAGEGACRSPPAAVGRRRIVASPQTHQRLHMPHREEWSGLRCAAVRWGVGMKEACTAFFCDQVGAINVGAQHQLKARYGLPPHPSHPHGPRLYPPPFWLHGAFSRCCWRFHGIVFSWPWDKCWGL